MFKLRMMADMLEWTEMATIENLPHWYCESSNEYDRSTRYAMACENASRHSSGNIPTNNEGSIF